MLLTESRCSATDTPPALVWVDVQWSGAANCGGHTWQVDAFNTIQAGLDAVKPGGAVSVLAGVYPERVTIAKPLTLSGPCAGVNPNAPTAHDPFAANPQRGEAAVEAVIVPPAVDIEPEGQPLLEIRVNDVAIDGMVLDGHNPRLRDGRLLNGVTMQACMGIRNNGPAGEKR